MRLHVFSRAVSTWQQTKQSSPEQSEVLKHYQECPENPHITGEA